MNSGKRHQSNPANPVASNGNAELRGAVLRIPRDSSFAISNTPEAVEIALSVEAIAEIRASLTRPAPFRDYHTVAEEAERIGLSEKTVRNLLKEKRAPHYVIGSDIRIDPVALDEWMDQNCAVGKRRMNMSQRPDK
jgi:excisionase family DNA binding protein